MKKTMILCSLGLKYIEYDFKNERLKCIGCDEEKSITEQIKKGLTEGKLYSDNCECGSWRLRTSC